MVVEFIIQKNNASGLSCHAITMLMNRNKTIVVDTRSQAEFDKSHLVDAIQQSQENLDRYIKTLKTKYRKALPSIVLCSSKGDKKAIIKLFKNNGFEIFCIKGGLSAWQQDNMPFVSSKEKVQPVSKSAAKPEALAKGKAKTKATTKTKTAKTPKK